MPVKIDHDRHAMRDRDQLSAASALLYVKATLITATEMTCNSTEAKPLSSEPHPASAQPGTSLMQTVITFSTRHDSNDLDPPQPSQPKQLSVHDAAHAMGIEQSESRSDLRAQVGLRTRRDADGREGLANARLASALVVPVGWSWTVPHPGRL